MMDHKVQRIKKGEDMATPKPMLLAIAAIAVVAIVIAAAFALSGNAGDDTGLPGNDDNDDNNDNNNNNKDNDDDEGGIYDISEEDGVITITGTGSVKTSKFDLAAGVAIVEAGYTGLDMSNFIVKVCSDEDNYDLTFNEIGTYRGARIVGIIEDAVVGPVPGEVYVEVTSQGTWEIEIEQPQVTKDEAHTSPTSFEGPGDMVLGPFYFDSEVEFAFEHDGDGTLVVALYANDGKLVGSNIASMAGEPVDSNSIFFTGTGYGNPDAGLYWINVLYDGDWSLNVSPELPL